MRLAASGKVRQRGPARFYLRDKVRELANEPLPERGCFPPNLRPLAERRAAQRARYPCIKPNATDAVCHDDSSGISETRLRDSILALESDGGMSKLLIICWIGFLCCAAIGCGRGRSGDAMEAIAGRERAIELLQKAYDAFNRGDMAGLDPQIEWTEPDSFPGGGTYHGTAEVQGYLTRSRAGWAEGRSEPER